MANKKPTHPPTHAARKQQPRILLICIERINTPSVLKGFNFLFVRGCWISPNLLYSVPEHELLNVALSQRLGEVNLPTLKAAVKYSAELIKTEHGFSTRRLRRRNLS